jgi:cobalt-precorrin 5A hydrolase
MKLAIYAITVNGAQQAQRLKRALPFADLFIAEVAYPAVTDPAQGDGGTESTVAQQGTTALLKYPLSDFVAERFDQYDGHIFIFATGIVSRIISPLIKDKRLDPAVVCLDEQANFAIAMLSGHRGGANELAVRVAQVVKAQPVITTASDVSESVSADMLGAPFGWQLDPLSEPSITAVSAAIVNQQPVVIVQQAGEKTWWQYDKRMPANIISHSRLADIDANDYRGLLLVSDQRAPDLSEWQQRAVLWRPKSLVLGIGCDRDTPLAVLEAGIAAFSQQHDLATASIASITSIDLKKDEQGLLALSAKQQWPFTTYLAEALDGVQGIENPSDYVKKVTGSRSVAEAAALKHSQTSQLVVPKWVFKQDGFNMTIACCRLSFSESLVQHKRKNWFGEKKHGSEQRHGVADSSQIDVRVNAHGSAVVDGYQCKPKHVDLDRPMLFHRHHILLCEGARCAKAGSKNLAHNLRGLLKEMGLASGDQRIKISRTLCAGACRNRATLVIYERASHAIDQSKPLVNNGVWLKNIEQFSQQQWQRLFRALAEHRPLTEVLDSRYFTVLESPTEETDCG